MAFKLKRFGDWKRVEAILNAPSFDKRLNNNIRLAHSRVALMYRKDVREAIKGKKYAPNKAMTISIKGSSTPLVDNGDLWAAITYKVYPGHEKVEIGIKRSAAGKGKVKLWNIASILHDGTTIRVTPRMRRFFQTMFNAGESGWYPLAPSTVAIRIPGRPFFLAPFTENEDKYLREYEKATLKTVGGK